MSTWRVILSLAVVLLACDEDCPEGAHAEDGRCVHDVTGRDGGGEGEGEGEGEGCSPLCEGQAARCDLKTLTCVECLVHDDCGGASPRCEANACVACVEGGDECPGACFAEGSDSPGDDDLTPGSCVECNVDDDCDPGGAEVCDAWTHECIDATLTVGQCGACRADADCAEGSLCVEVRFPRGGGPDDVIGTYCSVDCSTLGDSADCAGVAAGGNRCGAGLTRAGESVSACLPSTTTCEAYLHFGTFCLSDATCSHDGARGDADGLCAGDQCTFRCEDAGDCPGTQCVEEACAP